MSVRKSILYTLIITAGVALISFSITNIAKAIWADSSPEVQETEMVIGTMDSETVDSESIDSEIAADDTGIYVPVEEIQVEPSTESSSPGTSAALSSPPILDTEFFKPEAPERIKISSISLDAEIIPASSETVLLAGNEYIRWIAPDEPVVGWHSTSALLGEAGNTVLNGHHNVHGSIFARLSELTAGDTITLFSENQIFIYEIRQVMILAEKYEDIYIRTRNASWIQPSSDERLTLITCWPPESNTHRVIVVAVPVDN